MSWALRIEPVAPQVPDHVFIEIHLPGRDRPRCMFLPRSHADTAIDVLTDILEELSEAREAAEACHARLRVVEDQGR